MPGSRRSRCGALSTIGDEADVNAAWLNGFSVGSRDGVDELRPHDQELEAALGSLPTNQRSVIVLRYLDDWSVAEIADGLGLTYRAVESLLARARRSLRTALEESS